MNLLVNVDVDDLERAVRFYREALGLEVGRRVGEDGIEMLGASSPIYLLRKTAGSEVSTATAQRRDYRRHWTPIHLDLVVDEIEDAVERAVAAGATLEAQISRRRSRRAGGGGSR